MYLGKNSGFSFFGGNGFKVGETGKFRAGFRMFDCRETEGFV